MGTPQFICSSAVDIENGSSFRMLLDTISIRAQIFGPLFLFFYFSSFIERYSP